MHHELTAFWHMFSATLVSIRAMLHRHRLFVALPIFLLAVVVTVGASQRASVTTTALPLGPVNTAGTIQLTEQIQGILSQGSIVERTAGVPRLTEGSLLLKGAGMTEIDAATLHLQSWSGGFSVAVQGQTVTVAALTTPVLVSGPDGIVLVPVRFQWRGQDTKTATIRPLPPAFIGEQTGLLNSLPDNSAASPLELPTVYFPLPTSLADLLSLPATRMREAANESQTLLASLTSSLMNGNKADLQRLLQQGAADGLHLASSAQPVVPFLLHKAVEQGMTAWFLPSFLTSTERWTLASIHPSLRDLAWTDPMTSTIPSDHLLPSLLALPQSDVLTEGASPLTIEAWGRAFSDYLSQQKNPLETIQSFLPKMDATISHTNALGYPKRAQDYAEALLDVLHPLKDLPASLQPYVADLTALSDRALPPASVLPVPSANAASSVQSASSSSPLPLLTSEEIHARAEQALQGVSALFTIKTVIEPLTNTNTARITGIALPTPRGEELTEFTYNVATDHVIGLTKDGKTLPYEVTLKQFVEWVKSGK